MISHEMPKLIKYLEKKIESIDNIIGHHYPISLTNNYLRIICQNLDILAKELPAVSLVELRLIWSVGAKFFNFCISHFHFLQLHANESNDVYQFLEISVLFLDHVLKSYETRFPDQLTSQYCEQVASTIIYRINTLEVVQNRASDKMIRQLTFSAYLNYTRAYKFLSDDDSDKDRIRIIFQILDSHEAFIKCSQRGHQETLASITFLYNTAKTFFEKIPEHEASAAMRCLKFRQKALVLWQEQGVDVAPPFIEDWNHICTLEAKAHEMLLGQIKGSYSEETLAQYIRYQSLSNINHQQAMEEYKDNQYLDVEEAVAAEAVMDEKSENEFVASLLLD